MVIAGSSKWELPQLTWTLVPSKSSLTGLSGRAPMMLDANRPATRTWPGSATSAETRTLVDTSRSKPESWRPSSVASMSTPRRIGWLALLGRLRATQASAEEKSSLDTVKLTCWSTRGVLSLASLWSSPFAGTHTSRPVGLTVPSGHPGRARPGGQNVEAIRRCAHRLFLLGVLHGNFGSSSRGCGFCG